MQLKIVVAAGQVFAAASGSFSVPWPTLFAESLDYMKVFLLDVLTMLRTSCATPTSFYDNFFVTVVAFKVVACVIFFGLVIKKARASNTGFFAAVKLLSWSDYFKGEMM